MTYLRAASYENTPSRFGPNLYPVHGNGIFPKAVWELFMCFSTFLSRVQQTNWSITIRTCSYRLVSVIYLVGRNYDCYSTTFLFRVRNVFKFSATCKRGSLLFYFKWNIGREYDRVWKLWSRQQNRWQDLLWACFTPD